MPPRDGLRSFRSHRDVCVCTAITEGFLPGALVTIGSFLKTHPRFEGDLVVFHDGLPNGQQHVLRDAFGRLRLERISPALERRCLALGAALPKLANRLPMFFSLEAFNLSGYRKVLVCDADLLFRQHVDALLDAPGELACCGDGVYLQGQCREAATNMPCSRDAVPSGGLIEEPFNAGLLAIDGALPGPRLYAELIALVSPQTWAGTSILSADQLVLNRYFAGRQTLFDSSYNYLLGHASLLKTRHGLGIDDARVLHFNLPCKPWTVDSWISWGLRRPHRALPLLPAFEHWLAQYRQCTSDALLREAHRLSERARKRAGQEEGRRAASTIGAH